MIGANDNMTVCTKKIHFPLVDVGLNLQIPLVISGVIDDATEVETEPIYNIIMKILPY